MAKRKEETDAAPASTTQAKPGAPIVHGTENAEGVPGEAANTQTPIVHGTEPTAPDKS